MIPLTKIFSDPRNRYIFLLWLRFMALGLAIGTLFIIFMTFDQRITDLDNRVNDLEESNHLVREQLSLVLSKIPVRLDGDEYELEIIKVPHPDDDPDSLDT